MTHWFQTTIYASSPHDAEIISECLSELSAQAITFQDAADEPLYEPEINTTPLWNSVIVRGLFSAETNMENIIKQLQNDLIGIHWNYTIETVEESDWQNTWKKDFKPVCFGGRLWIVPSWHEIPDPKGINLQLDPGLAFGTGSHPTTRLCLEWLATHDLKNKTMIDYGCGSGILALAAIKLGAIKVLAVDIDQALDATRDNAQRNNISDSQLTPKMADELSDSRVDIVIANILANPLIELAPRLSQLCKSDGKLVLSGILEEQVEDVVAADKPYVDLTCSAKLEEWIVL